MTELPNHVAAVKGFSPTSGSSNRRNNVGGQMALAYIRAPHNALRYHFATKLKFPLDKFPPIVLWR
jgi:hypothetical protein